MSFSSDVKDELVKLVPNESHCRYAELAALFSFFAKVEYSPEIKVIMPDDNSAALRKCFTLLNKTFNIRTDELRKTQIKGKQFYELTPSDSDISKVFEKINPKDPMHLLKRDCCKRAYLRGAFLGSGYINDPEKEYHFEILSDEDEYSKLLTYLFSTFNISPKCSQRKRYRVTYLKEAGSVSDILSVIGAHKSMMDMANTRIVKEVRNSVNRRNNCDMANISKAVNAASKQIEDIELIEKKIGLGALPDTLREMAVIRLDHPDSSLTELGELTDPPVGKSGANHRLRKISAIADELRLEREKR